MRVRGGTAAARKQARERFLDPLLSHLDVNGIGHLPEVADAEPPHTPGGCPFQAWSVAEALRLDRVVLAPAAARHRPQHFAHICGFGQSGDAAQSVYGTRHCAGI